MQRHKQRIAYLDIAKGISILIVVLHHTPHVIAELDIFDNIAMRLSDIEFTYITFFMPVFFIITGMISSNKYKFKKRDFIFHNFRGILLPGFTMGVICNWISLITNGETSIIEYFKLGFSTFLKNGGPYWFLTALFLSKIIHWSISSYIINDWNRVVFFLLLLITGCIMSGSNIPEYWYIEHAFLLTLFLFIGQKIHQYNILSKKRLVLFVSFFYIYMIVLLHLLEIDIPYVTAKIHLSVYQIPLFLLLSTSGAIMILGISRLIYSNRLLQYYGQRSLLVYGFHIAVLFVMFRILQSYLGVNAFFSIMVIVLSIVVTLLLVIVFSYLLNLKYIRLAMGKFKK